MKKAYYMKFVNSTDDWWHFGVYQEFQYPQKLDSIIWKSVGLPDHAHDYIEWNEMDYGVAITKYREDRYDTIQIVNAELGDTYEVIRKYGIAGISDTPIHTGGASNILGLVNNTNPAKLVDMGFALGGTVIAAQKDVPGQQTSQYKVNLKYHVALYEEIRQGHLVYTGTAPIEVEYPDGYTFATVTAIKDAGNTCTIVEYSNPPWVIPTIRD